MVNHEKNKYKVRFLSKEIEDFVKYLGVEKNYASNTILSYERDLIKFSNFLDKKKVNNLIVIDSEIINLFVMELRHGNTSGKSLKRYLSSIRVFFNFLTILS